MEEMRLKQWTTIVWAYATLDYVLCITLKVINLGYGFMTLLGVDASLSFLHYVMQDQP